MLGQEFDSNQTTLKNVILKKKVILSLTVLGAQQTPGFSSLYPKEGEKSREFLCFL